MKKIDLWMLAALVGGLFGASCGAPANDSQPAGIDAEQRIKTTVVKLQPDGHHEISTYYATPEQIELEEQQLLDAQRRQVAGLTIEAIVPGSCSSPTTVWAYDLPSAGKYPGYARCCLDNNSCSISQAYINDVCGFPYMASMRSFALGGWFGDENDCQREFGVNHLFTSFDCYPVDWIAMHGQNCTPH